MPARSPIATRPAGPIHLLSKAYFRKYETPIRRAAMPIRFSQCEPMRDSRSISCSGDAVAGVDGIGGSGASGGGAAVGGKRSAAFCRGTDGVAALTGATWGGRSAGQEL